MVNVQRELSHSIRCGSRLCIAGGTMCSLDMCIVEFMNRALGKIRTFSDCPISRDTLETDGGATTEDVISDALRELLSCHGAKIVRL